MTDAQSTLSSTRTIGKFLRVGTCSETLCSVLDRAYGYPMPLEERASAPLAGGIMQHGFQCGQVWGAALAAGAQAHRLFGPGSQAETAAIVAAQRIVDSFRARYDSIDCRAIIDMEFGDKVQISHVYRYFRKNGLKCFRMAAHYAPVAYEEIDAALSEEQPATQASPVGCAALVARKSGASEMHAVMAAGFAGGVGLSGDACGALAAAMWIIDMNDRKRGVDKVGFKSPRLAELADRFMDCSDSRFLCSEIVGRRFESIADHAGFLGDGGCARIVEGLTAR
jgi:hypothetical protein